MPHHTEFSAASRNRIRAAGERAAAGPVASVGDDEGWGPGVVLAHLAFWDRMVLARWQRADAQGEEFPPSLAPIVADLVNEAAFAQWSTLSVRDATNLAMSAAEAIDAYLDNVPAARIEAARAAGFERLVDRTIHRNDHLDAVERAG